MGLRQISCSLQNPTGLIRAIRDIRVRLSLQQQRPRSLIRVIRDIRVRLSLQQQRPRSLIRVIRDIRVPLTTQATETTDLFVQFALLLLVDQWVFDKSRVRLPYTNFSPLFICTSFTNFLTSADESSFLHINSTLSSSATI